MVVGQFGKLPLGQVINDPTRLVASWSYDLLRGGLWWWDWGGGAGVKGYGAIVLGAASRGKRRR